MDDNQHKIILAEYRHESLKFHTLLHGGLQKRPTVRMFPTGVQSPTPSQNSVLILRELGTQNLSFFVLSIPHKKVCLKSMKYGLPWLLLLLFSC